VATGATHVVSGGLQPEATGATANGKPVGGPQVAGAAAAGLPEAVVASVRVRRELGSLPVYVRPGSILPIEPLVESTEEKPSGPLTLRVFPGPDCHGALYQDDGRTFAYEHGEFLRMSFTCHQSADGNVAVHIGRHVGSYPAWWKMIDVEVNGPARPPVSATVNGRGAALKAAGGAMVVQVPDNGMGMDVVVRE
jgi:alpha-glucosidase